MTPALSANGFDELRSFVCSDVRGVCGKTSLVRCAAILVETRL
jgi:hypothetical protein